MRIEETLTRKVGQHDEGGRHQLPVHVLAVGEEQDDDDDNIYDSVGEETDVDSLPQALSVEDCGVEHVARETEDSEHRNEHRRDDHGHPVLGLNKAKTLSERTVLDESLNPEKDIK